MSSKISPDEGWYVRQTARNNLPQHCPLAANDKCPRYFLSQKHASSAGAASLDIKEDTVSCLERKWETSDVFSSNELSVGHYLNDGWLRGVDGFCPEVTARIVGLYCTSLRTYPDEDSRKAFHAMLDEQHATKDDPRWNWMIVDPRHYSACHEFSVYGSQELLKPSKTKKRKGSLSPRLRFRVFDRDHFRCVYCGATGTNSALHVDHKISVIAGGTDDIDNLVTACERCNLGKGAKSVTEI